MLLVESSATRPMWRRRPSSTSSATSSSATAFVRAASSWQHHSITLPGDGKNPFLSARSGRRENRRRMASARSGHAEGGTAIGTHPRRQPWTRTNEPAVIHCSSFGEDKEWTLCSFVMSFDAEVYAGTKINDEVHRSKPVGRDR